MEKGSNWSELPKQIMSESSLNGMFRRMRSYFSAGDFDLALLTVFPVVPEQFKKDIVLVAAETTNFPAGITFNQFATEFGTRLTETTAWTEFEDKIIAFSEKNPCYLVTEVEGKYKYELVTKENSATLLTRGKYSLFQRLNKEHLS